MKLKELFEYEKSERGELKLLVTAVKLPSGAIEVITNTQELESKYEYLKNTYDDDFKLKNNHNVQIVGYIMV